MAVTTPHGVIEFDSRDRGVGKALYLERGYELASIRAALGWLRGHGLLAPGGTVVDVGANIGVTVIPLLAEGGFERALAVEPEPGNAELLVRNLARNGLSDRVTVAQCALSDTEGQATLELSGGNWGDHRVRSSAGTETAGESFGESRRKTVPVRVRTLDALIEATPAIPAASIRLVWADIQGHEGRLLAGARQRLPRAVPMVSEFWPYGLKRAGTRPEDFMALASERFEAFVALPTGTEARPLAELASWFDMLSQPRQMGQVLLLPRA